MNSAIGWISAAVILGLLAFATVRIVRSWRAYFRGEAPEGDPGVMFADPDQPGRQFLPPDPEDLPPEPEELS